MHGLAFLFVKIERAQDVTTRKRTISSIQARFMRIDLFVLCRV